MGANAYFITILWQCQCKFDHDTSLKQSSHMRQTPTEVVLMKME